MGENEGFTGKLAVETVTKYFNFPVYKWADTSAIGLSNGGIVPMLRAVFSSYKTNLKIGDRIGILIFLLRIKNTGRTDIDLNETSYLKKATFIDGGGGYVVSGSPSQKLTSIFVDNNISKKGSTILIKDASGKSGVAEDVGEVIQVIGAKVASIQRIDKKDVDCFVSGKNSEFSKKIARIFSCDIDEDKLESSFDFEIQIGEQFAKRF